MAGLQRSAQTFRRSGSSGLVWDERFLTDATGTAPAGRQHHQPELRHSRSVGSAIVVAMQRRGGEELEERDDKKWKLALAKPTNRRDHHHQKRREEELQVPAGTARKPALFRTRDVAPAAEPPSPRVPAGCCGPCAIFRDAAGARRSSSSLPRRANKTKR